MKRIYTIGHSNMSPEKLIELLQFHSIRILVDIRSQPGSRKFPWFNQENLYPMLNAVGIGYVWNPVIGGRRSKKYDLDEPVNAGWTVKSFERYANYMLHREWLRGMLMLEAMASTCNVAIMCAECKFVQCHRRLVSDGLVVRGWDVEHIVGKRLESHVLGKFGPEPEVSGFRLTYPGAYQIALKI